MAFMRAVSILLILMHFYWFCYSFFLEKGWTLQIINKILGNFQRTANLFSYYIPKFFAFGIISIKLFRDKRSKQEKLVGLK
jgi:hypothetical protein